jgi:hypothetical protein
MLTGAHFLSKFVGRVHRRVNFPSENPLCVPERINDLAEGDTSDHHQIDVALVANLTAGR